MSVCFTHAGTEVIDRYARLCRSLQVHAHPIKGRLVNPRNVLRCTSFVTVRAIQEKNIYNVTQKTVNAVAWLCSSAAAISDDLQICLKDIPNSTCIFSKT